MSRFQRARQKRLLFLSSEMKSCRTARHCLPVTPRTSPPFLPRARHQAQSPSPCPTPPFLSRHSWKSWKMWIWFQLTSVSFPFCLEGIATANMASFSSTCVKNPNQNQPSTLKMQEQVWGGDSQLHTGAEFSYQSRPRLWTRFFFLQEVLFKIVTLKEKKTSFPCQLINF